LFNKIKLKDSYINFKERKRYEY